MAIRLRRAVDLPPMLGPDRTAIESSWRTSFLTQPGLSGAIQYGHMPFNLRELPPSAHMDEPEPGGSIFSCRL